MSDPRLKLPRSHAYLYIRNDGVTVKMDFAKMKLDFLDEILQMAIANAAPQFAEEPKR